MQSDENKELIVPKRITAEIDDQTVRSFLRPRSDLTYRAIQGLQVSNVSVFQSLLTGSIIRDTKFVSVNFARSDLDGMRVEQTVFEQCDFTTCDIRSSHFSQVEFRSCVLDKAFIDDCDFAGCILTDCTLQGSSLTQMRFHQTSFDQCNFAQSTSLHNRFANCRFSDTTLGDCTILFSIFDDCVLQNVKINADAIGSILGLTRDQLNNLTLMFLGRDETRPHDGDIVQLLLAEYQRRHWHLGEFVHTLNMKLSSTVSAFDKYLDDSRRRFAQMGFVKGDELRFLGDVVEELSARQRLPLLTALDIIRWCAVLRSELGKDQTNVGSSGDQLNMLANRTNWILYAMINRLEEEMPRFNLTSGDASTHLKVTFEQKPDLPLLELLGQIGKASNLSLAHGSYLVRSGRGSYVEVISTTLFTTFAFQVFLYLVNGCVIQLTELKERTKLLSRAGTPKDYRFALTPIQPTSPVILSVVQGLAQYTRGLPLLRESSLGGFDTSNIRHVEIVPPEKAKRRTQRRTPRRP